MWKNLYKKPYQTWKTVVTTFKKHQNVPMRTQKKRKIFFHRFLSEYTFLPTLLLFLKRENGNWVKWENWLEGRTHFLKNNQGKSRGERENTCMYVYTNIYI